MASATVRAARATAPAPSWGGTMSLEEKTWLTLLALLVGVALSIHDARGQGSTIDPGAKPVPVLRKIPSKGPAEAVPARPPRQVQRLPWFKGATRCIQEPGQPLRCE